MMSSRFHNADTRGVGIPVIRRHIHDRRIYTWDNMTDFTKHISLNVCKKKEKSEWVIKSVMGILRSDIFNVQDVVLSLTIPGLSAISGLLNPYTFTSIFHSECLFMINFPMEPKLSSRKYLILAINFENLPYTFSILPREHVRLKNNRKFSGLSHGLGNLPSWRRKGQRHQICLTHSTCDSNFSGDLWQEKWVEIWCIRMTNTPKRQTGHSQWH